MKVGFYQFKPEFGKVSRNLKKVLTALQDVEADLIVLPELAFTGYYFQDKTEVMSLAETINQSTTINALHTFCRAKNLYLVTGFAEKQLDKCFNSAVLIGPEGVIHSYRKLHLFYREKTYFDQGDVALQTHSLMDTRIGMMVCYDWAFPEVARSLAIDGAEIICHPANLVLPYCQQAMLVRGLENKVFTITANRYGKDSRPQGELKFTGKSQITLPAGDLLYRAASQRQDVYIADIEPEQSRDKQVTELDNLFADRRTEYYQALYHD